MTPAQTYKYTHTTLPAAALHSGRAASVCYCQPSGGLTELGWHPSPSDTRTNTRKQSYTHTHTHTITHTRLSLKTPSLMEIWTMRSECVNSVRPCRKQQNDKDLFIIVEINAQIIPAITRVIWDRLSIIILSARYTNLNL